MDRPEGTRESGEEMKRARPKTKKKKAKGTRKIYFAGGKVI